LVNHLENSEVNRNLQQPLVWFVSLTAANLQQY
jgi:hypothetical protein